MANLKAILDTTQTPLAVNSRMIIAPENRKTRSEITDITRFYKIIYTFNSLNLQGNEEQQFSDDKVPGGAPPLPQGGIVSFTGDSVFDMAITGQSPLYALVFHNDITRTASNTSSTAITVGADDVAVEARYTIVTTSGTTLDVEGKSHGVNVKERITLQTAGTSFKTNKWYTSISKISRGGTDVAATSITPSTDDDDGVLLTIDPSMESIIRSATAYVEEGGIPTKYLSMMGNSLSISATKGQLAKLNINWIALDRKDYTLLDGSTGANRGLNADRTNHATTRTLSRRVPGTAANNTDPTIIAANNLEGVSTTKFAGTKISFLAEIDGTLQRLPTETVNLEYSNNINFESLLDEQNQNRNIIPARKSLSITATMRRSDVNDDLAEAAESRQIIENICLRMRLVDGDGFDNRVDFILPRATVGYPQRGVADRDTVYQDIVFSGSPSTATATDWFKFTMRSRKENEYTDPTS